jgi:hypothetical protein
LRHSPLFVFAFLGIRSRRKYADTLRNKIAGGHSDNVNSKIKFNKVIASIEILLLIITVSVLILFFKSSSQEVKIASFIILGISSPIIVFLGARMVWGLKK